MNISNNYYCSTRKELIMKSLNLKLSSACKVISPRRLDYVSPYWDTPPSRFARKKVYRGSTAPTSNKNFKTMPKNF